LILVRHGRTAHNASRLLLGRLDVPLDELGLRQAAALGQVDVLRHAHRVVSSPLTRTRQTAEAFGRPFEVDPRLLEVDYGVYDGRPLDQATELFRHWPADVAWTPEGGESLADLGARVRAACDDLWPEAQEHDVVVVTHVSPIKAAVAWALGVGDEITARLTVDVASVHRVTPGGRGRPALRTFNETHHRPDA
jgi:broad specificity phosphatase PhoE